MRTQPITKTVLSYMDADTTVVEAMFNNPVANEIDVWMDKRSTESGAYWPRSFSNAPGEASFVLSFFSSSFSADPFRVFVTEQEETDHQLRRRTMD